MPRSGAEKPGGASVAFEVPGRAPAAYSGNARTFWAKQRREGHEYRDTVQLIVLSIQAHMMTPVRLTLTQRAVRLRDADNFLASFKPGLDGMVLAGLIPDDTPTHIPEVVIRHQKMQHERDECVHVLVERLDTEE